MGRTMGNPLVGFSTLGHRWEDGVLEKIMTPFEPC